MNFREEISFWGGVAIVAILAVVLFRVLAAGAVGQHVPGVRAASALIAPIPVPTKAPAA